MPRCSVSGHLAANTPIAVYFTVPGGDAHFTGDRFRLRLCVRHGHALLVLFLKRGANLLAEAELPEFCLGCAQPTSGTVFEARWYEGDWSCSVSYQLCDDCGQAPFETLAEGPVSYEKLPPRDKTGPRGSRHK